jgi:regulator of replication initiation timing
MNYMNYNECVRRVRVLEHKITTLVVDDKLTATVKDVCGQHRSLHDLNLELTQLKERLTRYREEIAAKKAAEKEAEHRRKQALLKCKRVRDAHIASQNRAEEKEEAEERRALQLIRAHTRLSKLSRVAAPIFNSWHAL